MSEDDCSNKDCNNKTITDKTSITIDKNTLFNLKITKAKLEEKNKKI